MTRFSHRAFTLIELLVVITIIGVLAAIALPIYGNVQLAAKRVQSLNNLRQLGAACISYCGDNNGSLPQQGDSQSWAAAAPTANPYESLQWYNALPRTYASSPNLSEYANNPAAFYASGSMFYVPAAKYPATKLTGPLFAVAFNSKLETKGYTNVRLQLVQIPAQTVLFLECGLTGEKTVTNAQAAYSNSTNESYAYASRLVARYGGNTILTFCDGHAEVVVGTSVVNSTDGKAFFPPNPGAMYYWSEQTSVDPGH